MAKDSTYSDDLCVHSLALLYSVHVQVYTPDYGIQDFHSELTPTVKLAYNGFDHYDANLSRKVSRNHPAPLPSQNGNNKVSSETIPCSKETSNQTLKILSINVN